MRSGREIIPPQDLYARPVSVGKGSSWEWELEGNLNQINPLNIIILNISLQFFPSVCFQLVQKIPEDSLNLMDAVFSQPRTSGSDFLLGRSYKVSFFFFLPCLYSRT